ncbi:MerR family transcriptional regulator [Pararhodobacter sp.]|uniref:MerR family transcriptional regulator n=1 Tax=Pararhodobacter sp. TaxID=2127056 RepID=UPI002AFE7DB0|nr:MerR family DNA-binding transcriptional regulator [Pararhodobacter sp.]MCA0203707.1 MerR family DNA-binding transcriptional regulator [Pseudomonadota bacterium]
MDQELLTIREMCEAFDVTPRTLRFYESKELISPIRDGQKRLYTRRDRGRLTLILRGKRFGFALEEMRQLLNLYDRGDQKGEQLKRTVAAARERLAQMEQQRDELNEAIDELRSQLEAGAEMLAAFRPAAE